NMARGGACARRSRMTANNQISEADFMERGAKFLGGCVREALVAAALVAATALAGAASAQNAAFHNAPASAKATKNPEGHSAEAATAGAAVYQQKCSLCHGQK